MLDDRIVITGIGLTAPNGNTLAEFRKNLVEGVARIQTVDMRYIGPVAAGVCDYDARKYQKRKEIRNGTRAGSIAIYCAREAVANCGIDWDNIDEEDVFENGVLVVEDVSEDDFDDSGVLVYSYKGKYVFMSFDIGGSLCECDVYDNLYDGGR